MPAGMPAASDLGNLATASIPNKLFYHRQGAGEFRAFAGAGIHFYPWPGPRVPCTIFLFIPLFVPCLVKFPLIPAMV